MLESCGSSGRAIVQNSQSLSGMPFFSFRWIASFKIGKIRAVISSGTRKFTKPERLEFPVFLRQESFFLPLRYGRKDYLF